MTTAHNNPPPSTGQRDSIPLPLATPHSTQPDNHAAGVLHALANSPNPIRSLYIHVPFCAHRCHYCDFYSIVDTRDRAEAFTLRLIDELIALAPAARGQPLNTIFIGGGTPTLLPIDLWLRLFSALEQHYDLSHIRAGNGEWTVECNPETATPELFACLVSGGVNRLSMGAQSFNPILLKALDRRHNPDNVYRALQLAREAGLHRCSIDMIFAVPGQTLDMWDTDLRTALAHGTTHLSAYNLTYEPNTPLTARMRRGEIEPATESLEIELFEHTGRVMAEHGLHRYEISNFAQPGQECRHNLAYWRQDPWLAAGPAASAHVLSATGLRGGSYRWKNVPRLDSYLNSPTVATGQSQGVAPVVDFEPPHPARLLAETIMTGLRLSEGINRSEVIDWATMLGVEHPLLEAAKAHEDAGQLTIDDGRWKVTESGLLIADGIASDLMVAVLE